MTAVRGLGAEDREAWLPIRSAADGGGPRGGTFVGGDQFLPAGGHEPVPTGGHGIVR